MIQQLYNALKYKANGEKKGSSISNFIMCKIVEKKKNNVVYSLDDLIFLKYNGTRSLKEKEKKSIALYLKPKYIKLKNI